jgi:pSer/pThr/pTyr-binding forkhead associated (FHA) protein
MSSERKGEARTTTAQPHATSASAKWIPVKSELHDTIARFDFSATFAAAPARSVALAGTSSACRERFRLPLGKSRIGRKDTEVMLSTLEVSRHHATIEVTTDAITVTDENSANGTFVNGVRITTAPLHDGDIIVFGPSLRFVVAEQTGDLAVPTPQPATPAQADSVAVLERERRQLAILFQIAMRYLGARGEDPSAILFDILPRVVRFEAAFVATRSAGKIRFRPHPGGAKLLAKEYRWLVDQCHSETVVWDEPGHEITLSSVRAESRALIPLFGGGCLGLLAGRPHEYGHQIDFLTVLGELHSAAASGSGPPGG